jgi:hypothetical protein
MGNSSSFARKFIQDITRSHSWVSNYLSSGRKYNSPTIGSSSKRGKRTITPEEINKNKLKRHRNVKKNA